MTDQLDELCEMLKPDREIKIRSRGEWTMYDRHGTWLSHGTLDDLRDKLKTFRKDAAVKTLLDAVGNMGSADAIMGPSYDERKDVYDAAEALEALL